MFDIFLVPVISCLSICDTTIVYPNVRSFVSVIHPGISNVLYQYYVYLTIAYIGSLIISTRYRFLFTPLIFPKMPLLFDTSRYLIDTPGMYSWHPAVSFGIPGLIYYILFSLVTGIVISHTSVRNKPDTIHFHPIHLPYIYGTWSTTRSLESPLPLKILSSLSLFFVPL